MKTAPAPCLRCGRTYKQRPSKLCGPCSIAHDQDGRAAIRKVRNAILAGLMPPATDCSCVDCGKPARDWDHRDYLRPLDVVPVCRSCNLLRGPAFDSVYRPGCEVTAHPPSLAASIPSRLIQEAGVPLS